MNDRRMGAFAPGTVAGVMQHCLGLSKELAYPRDDRFGLEESVFADPARSREVARTVTSDTIGNQQPLSLFSARLPMTKP
jgi:hypothetical protein